MKNNTYRPAGFTKAIAIIYLFYFGTLLILALLNETIAGIQLNRAYDAWMPLFLCIISVGVLRRTRWGWLLAYPVSAFLLLGVPIGTMLGGFMIYHLTKFRKAFTRWI